VIKVLHVSPVDRHQDLAPAACDSLGPRHILKGRGLVPGDGPCGAAGCCRARAEAALGIDCNIFLMTGVRAEASGRDAWHGALVGLAAAGGVITSVGFVPPGTFAVLATISATFVTELGFAIAFGILLDPSSYGRSSSPRAPWDLGHWR
jgi:hypothetical protein